MLPQVRRRRAVLDRPGSISVDRWVETSSATHHPQVWALHTVHRLQCNPPYPPTHQSPPVLHRCTCSTTERIKKYQKVLNIPTSSTGSIAICTLGCDPLVAKSNKTYPKVVRASCFAEVHLSNHCPGLLSLSHFYSSDMNGFFN